MIIGLENNRKVEKYKEALYKTKKRSQNVPKLRRKALKTVPKKLGSTTFGNSFAIPF